MNIILGKENIENIQDRYITLELDSFRFAPNSDAVTAYCLIDSLDITTMLQFEQWRDLHEGLMRNYKLANWNYCLQALDYLRGKWNGELDSFYQELQSRIEGLTRSGVDPKTWDSVIDRTATA